MASMAEQRKELRWKTINEIMLTYDMLSDEERRELVKSMANSLVFSMTFPQMEVYISDLEGLRSTPSCLR